MEDNNLLKLMNHLSKFFIVSCKISKSDPFFVKIKVLYINTILNYNVKKYYRKQIYDEIYTNLIWKFMHLQHLDMKPGFYRLDHLNYNILHEAIRLKKWHFFKEISIEILKDKLLMNDAINTTFHIKKIVISLKFI